MQAGSWFVENKQGRLVGGPFNQKAGQFDALRFTAAEGVRRLAHTQVAESGFRQGLEFRYDPAFSAVVSRVFAEKLNGLIYGQVKDIGDVQAFVSYFKHLFLEPFSLAAFTGKVDIGHKLHPDLNYPFAFAFFTTPAFYVEGKITGLVGPGSGQRLFGEQASDVIVSFDVCGRI